MLLHKGKVMKIVKFLTLLLFSTKLVSQDPLHEKVFYDEKAQSFYEGFSKIVDTKERKVIFLKIVNALIIPPSTCHELKNVSPYSPEKAEEWEEVFLPIFYNWLETVSSEDSFVGEYWLKPAGYFSSYKRRYEEDRTASTVKNERKAYCRALRKIVLQELTPKRTSKECLGKAWAAICKECDYLFTFSPEELEVYFARVLH